MDAISFVSVNLAALESSLTQSSVAVSCENWDICFNLAISDSVWNFSSMMKAFLEASHFKDKDNIFTESLNKYLKLRKQASEIARPETFELSKLFTAGNVLGEFQGSLRDFPFMINAKMAGIFNDALCYSPAIESQVSSIVQFCLMPTHTSFENIFDAGTPIFTKETSSASLSKFKAAIKSFSNLLSLGVDFFIDEVSFDSRLIEINGGLACQSSGRFFIENLCVRLDSPVLSMILDDDIRVKLQILFRFNLLWIFILHATEGLWRRNLRSAKSPFYFQLTQFLRQILICFNGGVEEQSIPLKGCSIFSWRDDLRKRLDSSIRRTLISNLKVATLYGQFVASSLLHIANDSPPSDVLSVVNNLMEHFKHLSSKGEVAADLILQRYEIKM